MTESEGSPEDFARLLGRDPEPAPKSADDDREVDAPDEIEAPRAGAGEEEISHADLIARAGPSEAKVARDLEFARMLHGQPREDER